MKPGLKPHKVNKQIKQQQNGATVCLKIPFHPNQPTFGRDEVHFFFSFFFFLTFVRSSPKPQNIEI